MLVKASSQLKKVSRLWRGYIGSYAQASPGGGCIVYSNLDLQARTMDVLIGLRSEIVGAGAGLTFGGYYEVEKFFKNFRRYQSAVQSGFAEIYREGTEEIEGLKDIISPTYFKDNAQNCQPAMIRGADENPVHMSTSVSLLVSEDVMVKMINAKGTKEQHGVVRCKLCWKENIPRFMSGYSNGIGTCWEKASQSLNELVDIPDLPMPFHHKHELRVFAELAWMAENGRLWLTPI